MPFAQGDLFGLTPRELEVLRLLATGKAHKQIALELGISYRTARSHAVAIYAKLYVNSSTEAVVKAHLLGLVHLLGMSPAAATIAQLLRMDPSALDELIEAGILNRKIIT